MKKFNVLWVAAAATLLAGCTKENTKPAGDSNGVLTVKIKSAKSSRAVLDGTVVTDAAVKTFEDNVTGFSAYVFNWDTGNLEASATSADGSPATITGLNTAGTKRVVVVANGDRADHPGGFIPEFETDPNYSRMESGYVALADQSFTAFDDLSKGFLMTGENATALTLSAGTNTAEITVKRVVAKIRLGDITFDDAVQLSDLAKFNLTGASIQRAASYSTLGTGAISTPTTPAPNWMGGVAGGSISGQGPTALANTPLDLETYLIALYNGPFNQGGTMGGVMGGTQDLIDVADSFTGTFGEAKPTGGATFDLYSPKGFWYVLPNSDNAKFTLLTLKGSYNGVDFFYPIEINDADATGPSVTQDYVKRNTIYTINIHFKNFTGVSDPDLPGVAASIDVTVVPSDWEGPVVQESTW